MASLLAGARGIAAAVEANGRAKPWRPDFPWDAKKLVFTVREPFPSRTTGTELVFGQVDGAAPLVIESHMAERGVIFSDGIEEDFLEFNSGARVRVEVSQRQGVLVV